MFYDPLGLLSNPTDVVLVEGEFSLAACVREGLPTMGCFGSNLGPWRAAALQRFNSVLILFDGDKAGNEGRMLAFAEHGQLLKGKLRSFKLPDGHDPASVPSGFGPTIRAKLTETVPFFDTLRGRLNA
jgi:DNA primase